MVINIRTVPEGHSAVTQETDLASFKDDLPVLCGKIACSAEIDRNGPVLYVHLVFRCKYELECSRCTEPFVFPVEGDLRLSISEKQAKRGSSEDDVEETEYYYDGRDLTVDVSPSIYEEIMVAFPLKPLCSESCRGFEIYADQALSASRDPKEGQEIDPRWEALKKLKKQ